MNIDELKGLLGTIQNLKDYHLENNWGSGIKNFMIIELIIMIIMVIFGTIGVMILNLFW